MPPAAAVTQSLEAPLSGTVPAGAHPGIINGAQSKRATPPATPRSHSEVPLSFLADVLLPALTSDFMSNANTHGYDWQVTV
jgi:hypothetical protein